MSAAESLERNRLVADCCGRRVDSGTMTARGLICDLCALESKLKMEATQMAKKNALEATGIKNKLAEVDGKKYLTKEYKGKEIKVTVHNAEDKKGFSFDGKLYRSLTDVARTITGQKIINGPKFFGLR